MQSDGRVDDRLLVIDAIVGGIIYAARATSKATVSLCSNIMRRVQTSKPVHQQTENHPNGGN